MNTAPPSSHPPDAHPQPLGPQQHRCQARHLWQRLNIWLYQHGIRSGILRSVLRFQCVVATLLVAGGLGLWPVTAWVFWCGVGAWLSVWNFFSLTKQAPQFILKKYRPSAGMSLFVRTQGRILLTVTAGMVCVVWVHAPIGALLAGLSLNMVAIVWVVAATRRQATVHQKQ